MARDTHEITSIEAENGLRQATFVLDTIDKQLREDQRFLLTDSLVKKLNQLATERLSNSPGRYRLSKITIEHSSHHPPPAKEVPGHVKSMCDYVNNHWDRSALHLAAYLMWRLNWIHPFEDGNGRTARAVSYIVLCVKLGLKLPGGRTIIEVIAENKREYYAALDKADDAEMQGKTDVRAMEGVIRDALNEQFVDYVDTTVAGRHLTGASATEHKVSGQVKSRWTSKLHEHINRYPFWYACATIVLPIVLTIAGILLS